MFTLQAQPTYWVNGDCITKKTISLCSMASLLLQLFLSLPCLLICSAIPNQIPKPYIVYMGSSSNANGGDAEIANSPHLKFLSSIFQSEERVKVSVIHSYNHAFNGFSAMLTEKEASILSGNEEIVSVFPDPILQLHTTRSWDFLNTQSGIGRSSFQLPHHLSTHDVIIGMIDTGIWPESPSFSDEGIGEIPSRWKGVCMEGSDFNKSNCNRKLIGARYYNNIQLKSNKITKGSPRDTVSHGTHTTSIAGGAPVSNASYYGLASGIARGGGPLPSTRIASYKACTEEGCSGATMLKAIDDAIRDGVDIISISVGRSSFYQPDFLNDPIAIGAFHAEQMGVMVVCSGGNEGPTSFTVVNSAPWIFTVAASSIDRDFQTTVLLGNGTTLQGSAINFSNLTRSKSYPLAFGGDVAANFTPVSEARSCYPGSLDRKKVVGKIIVCVGSNLMISRKIQKLVLEDAKAVGLILIDEDEKGLPFDSGVFPFAEVGNIAGSQILQYINSTKKPTASILPTVEISRFRPAPVVASFSSRGPGALTENILKPDIMAPGVAILGATIPITQEVRKQQQTSKFGIQSGTSMACPHVTGAAAFIKSVHPEWTSSIIKSALITTSTISNNMRKPLSNNPHEMGVGEISPIKALNPGLVFETTIHDYLLFLCYYGYTQKSIRAMSNTTFNCRHSTNTTSDHLISTINYPTISISKLDRRLAARVITRTVTNVGNINSTYVARVDAPVGLLVKVFPRKIAFVEGSSQRATFKVSFNGKEAFKNYNFGSITWLDNRLHTVRIVFAVNVE